jgi:uncharacterized repeat protein (TIGR01451 family)
VVTCSVSSLAVGTTLVAQITPVAVAAGTSSVLAELLSSDSHPDNDIASLTVDVTPSTADVSLSIPGPQYARVGELLDYYVYLSNTGPGTATGLAVTMMTPPGLIRTYVYGCEPDDCRIVRVAPGATALVGVTYQVPATYSGPVPIVFSASVTTASQDPDLTNNQDSESTPFIPPPAPLDFYTVTPCRLYDSRQAVEGALVPGVPRLIWPMGKCGIPYSSVRALAVNVTVTGATAPGNVRLYPGYSPVPNVSMVNYTAGQTRASNAVVTLSPEGYMAVLASQATGTVHVIIDVTGFFQ